MKSALWRVLVGISIALSGYFASASLAVAQDAGFYAGAAVGQTKMKDACEGIGAGVACDDTDTGWKVFAGYQFNKNFGAELGYVDLGAATASGFGAVADIKAKGFELLGVGTLPLGERFSLIGKAGLFRWDVDATASGPGGSIAIGETGTDFTYGIGLQYEFTKGIAARLEFQRYNDVGDNNTTGKSDLDLMSIGILFRF